MTQFSSNQTWHPKYWQCCLAGISKTTSRIFIFSIVLGVELVFCYQNCSDLLWEKIVLVIEKTFEIRGWRPRIFKNFEIAWTIYSNSERSEQFLVTECFFNLFLEISQVSKNRTIIIQILKNYWSLEIGMKS